MITLFVKTAANLKEKIQGLIGKVIELPAGTIEKKSIKMYMPIDISIL